MGIQINLQELLQKYKPNRDIFEGDSENMVILKEAVEQLPPADRIIFLLYVEMGSYRKVAKILGLSHTIIYKQCKMIRLEIREWIEKHYPINNDLIMKFK